MVKVFISSVIRDFGQFRGAARDVVIKASMQPVMAEDPVLFPAQSLSPQTGCPTEDKKPGYGHT